MDRFKKSINRNAPTTLTRVVLCARVSTEDQKRYGFSLGVQIDVMRQYAAQHEFLVVGEFQDDCSGTIAIAERPEGRKAVALLRSGEADAIIVHQVDRLARDIIDALVAVRSFLRMGRRVFALDIGEIHSENDISLVIKAWQADDERDKIAIRTSNGRYDKARMGKVVGTGFAPLGYHFVLNTEPGPKHGKRIGLEIYEPEAKLVRLIYRWYLEGEDPDHVPLSIRSIARRLSEMGIPSPGERNGRPRKRAPCMWTNSTVLKILTTETYVGLWRFGRVNRWNGQHKKRPLEEQVPVKIPAIIDRELWNAVQARRDYNRRMSKRNGKNEYLLRGYLRCGCGAMMSGESCGARHHFYYRCRAATSRIATLEPVCRERLVRQEVIEPLLWDFLKKAITSDIDLEQALREAQQAELANLEPKREQLEAVLEMIKETEQEATNLANALGRVAGGAVGKALGDRIAELERRYTLQIQKRDELLAALSGTKLTNQEIEAAAQFREDVVKGFDNPTFEDKRRLFEVLQLEVTIRDHKAFVKCVLPVEPVVFELRHY